MKVVVIQVPKCQRLQELKPPSLLTSLASPARRCCECSSAGHGESQNGSFAMRSLSIAPLCPHLTPQPGSWAPLAHGLGHSCSSQVTPAAPTGGRSLSRICQIYVIQGDPPHGNGLWNSQRHSVQRSSQNLSSFLLCCKPICREDKQMKKKKSKKIQV